MSDLKKLDFQKIRTNISKEDMSRAPRYRGDIFVLEYKEIDVVKNEHRLEMFGVSSNGSWMDVGYVLIIDGEPTYLVGIYEPHGCEINTERGIITVWGHEEIINLWLDNYETQTFYTH